jgi:hypothetical protein
MFLSMADAEQKNLREGMIARLWATPLAQRLAVLAGLALIGIGYVLILDVSTLPNSADLQTVTRQAVGGMALVVFGGVVEVLVLLGVVRR